MLSHQEVIDREFAPLLKVGDNYEKIVLSMDEFFPNDFQGIRRLNIIDWLVEK